MEKHNEKGVKLLSVLGLLLTTMIWGGSFVAMKNSVDILEPTFLLAVRFTIATAALLLVFHKKLKHLNRESLKCGLILGVLLELSYLFQTYGIKYTTASKNAFITTLYVILVPFLHWGVSKRRPALKNIVAAAMAVVGLALLTLEGDLGINLGDFLTLICGFCFALHMVYIDKFTEKHDPIFLTIIQIGVVGLSNWFFVPVFDGPGAYDFQALMDLDLIMGLLYLAIFSTMVGFLLQNVCQKYLSANTTALLLSMESVFGALFSVILLHEVLAGKMLLGCILMFLAVVVSEMHIRKPRKEIDG
ncbi:MAG: DMT family transporter [Lachnospiraceae bacterium]|nr:DMT family transporter [Lachnospiraceae bacterium]